MADSEIPESLWPRLSEVIAARYGMDFPRNRRGDLTRALERAAGELGRVNAADCARWLVSATPSKSEMQVLATHLTVGETYFFREPKTLEAVSRYVLPRLIRARETTGRRLRIWSAACCTGEEPYTLAILLSQVIPNFAEWHITILATDLNEHFLRKASAGVYGEWSFRDTPPGFKERYFRRQTDGRYAILPEFRKRVTFQPLNLVEDAFPSLATESNAMDLIFCRNVLIYFTPAQTRKVIDRLHRALVPDGWLAVSPSEVSQTLFTDFKSEYFSGATLYRHRPAGESVEPRGGFSAMEASPSFFAPEVDSWAPLPAGESSHPAGTEVAAKLYEAGNYAEAADALRTTAAPPASNEEFSLLARSLANQGRLPEALTCCDCWISADKLEASAHYLRAVVLQELGQEKEAGRALHRAIYLQPGLVLAHFALGNLARGDGLMSAAAKHFGNALRLLQDAMPDEPVPHADGISVRRLSEIINSLLGAEAAR